MGEGGTGCDQIKDQPILSAISTSLSEHSDAFSRSLRYLWDLLWKKIFFNVLKI